LLREIQEIGHRRFRGLETNSVPPRNRGCDGIGRCRQFAQQWMLAGNVIKPVCHPPQFAGLQQSLNRHPNGVRRTEIKEIRPGGADAAGVCHANGLKVLNEKFNLMPIKTAAQDLTEILPLAA
jgi:hypothetical protein